ncbi:MAG TPA: hypothetical protein VKB69_10370 [Micromonosporaceae bacterium]|nr:hypothetical protein [Micromonosporaceae bacterium]
MRLYAQSATFDRFLDIAETFWRNNTLPTGDDGAVILTEALHQDIRVTLRNLSVANGLRRIFPASIAVVTGTDDDWYEALWSGFDTSLVDRLARAYGAEGVVDIHALVDKRISDDGRDEPELIVTGRRIADVTPGIPAADLDAIVDATACRLLRVPRLTDADRAGATYARVRRRSIEISRYYDMLFTTLRPAAMITSHVDYNQWGLGVEAAMRFGIPVIHVQSTGTLKAYALFPSQRRGAATFRAELTHQIGDFFDKHVYGNREQIRRSAELISWRAKGNLGRPSWWRAGNSADFEVRTGAERESLRPHGLDRFGFDRDNPVVAVFNHAVSDALGTNVEFFDDLGAWFEETVAYAADRTDANWVFLDHPSQSLYDTTGFFEGIAERYAGRRHMAFRRSRALSKNMLWSLTDLGVTVRGSVSNELPAYGLPTLQAGWSEWSACGLSAVASDQDDYWRRLDQMISGIAAGVPQLEPEQVERARLWHWLYRSGADVSTQLVQHWEAKASDDLMLRIYDAMAHIESDGDPLFASVRRMWTRKEPMLTRFDMSMSTESLGAELWG